MMISKSRDWYYNSDGEMSEEEYENEDYIESEPEDEVGISSDILPKYRQCIKERKMFYKSKYGKSKLKIAFPLPKFTKGWRYYWRKNKFQERIDCRAKSQGTYVPETGGTPLKNTILQKESKISGNKANTKNVQSSQKPNVNQPTGSNISASISDSPLDVMGSNLKTNALILGGVALIGVVAYFIFLRK